MRDLEDFEGMVRERCVLLPLSTNVLVNHKQGIWKTLKRWFSFYEIKEAASQGGYFEWYLCSGGC